ncbi:MAG: nucleotidyl transferase AbiEii/AbiGii toxin family protein [Pedobacter sp.]|nr:nucleotidyl transferase AbiEii/AbiGii toxin family protein [Pedobacter sp.]
MNDELLKDFFLVGGTALSLQIGHRISIDLDLFTMVSFDDNQMLSGLEDKYKFQLDYQSKNTLKGEIDGVKVDLITHNYPLVKPLLNSDGVRMASPDDIAAMKLNAISGNGTRLKDFIDIAYLSSSMTLSQMVDAYEAKYSSRNPAMVIKALDYHRDINFNEPIEMLEGKYKWKDIEQRLGQITLHPTKMFNQIYELKPHTQKEEKQSRNQGLGLSR